MLARRLLSFAFVGLVLVACNDVPSKKDALAMVQSDVKEDATCTLPITLLPLLKMQHTTKAVCVPRETNPAGKATLDNAMGCLNALVAAGVTQTMPDAYMAEWPDEVSGAGFDAISPYDRSARTLVFKGCVKMVDDLRAGQFRCGQAKADKIIHEAKKDDTHASVEYSRVITLNPALAQIDAACGAVTRPGPDATAVFEKSADKQWHVLPDGVPAASPSASK